jgi:hypothetical protein
VPPPDDKSIVVVVLGPAVILGLLSALLLWLRERHKKPDK